MWKSIRTSAIPARVAMLIAVLASSVMLPSAASEPQRFEAVESHMGTLARITVYAADIDTAKTAITAGFARITALDQTLSDYRPASELSQLTTRAVDADVPVSDDLWRVLEASQALAVATDGAFDVTIGPVARLWREARRSSRLPSAEARAAAAARTGFHHLHLDPRRRTVRVDRAGMQLDVGAIGKGYAASEALAAVSATGIRSALVAISGDLAFSAAPPGRRGWRIGLHALDGASTTVPSTLELTYAAVSTSGSESQHLDVDGTRYSHVVDPATATGLTDDLTVTVIARHGLDADGLDTAIGLLGVTRGLALVADRRDVAALLVRREAQERRVYTSPGLASLVERLSTQVSAVAFP